MLMKQSALRTARRPFLGRPGTLRLPLSRDEHAVADLSVSLGAAARSTLCDAFANAHRSIDAQFYSVGDAAVVDSLNRAALRGVEVTVHVEGDRGRYRHRGAHAPVDAHVRASAALYAQRFSAGVRWVVEADPLVLEHGKAAVVDGTRAFVATANPNEDGFSAPGEVLIEDDAPDDVAAVHDAIEGTAAQSARVVSGPGSATRQRIAHLLEATRPERIAVEDLSDRDLIQTLVARRRRGLRDEVLVKCERGTPILPLGLLAASGVAVRTLAGAHLHDKYIDAGEQVYVGSANLTRNGLDEAREIGIVARAADFVDGGASLRADFDRMWSAAVPTPARPES
jgi:phosphatidylserine/phosphatidylglycerophosphate/cardiolipin synthase-like enzyme